MGETEDQSRILFGNDKFEWDVAARHALRQIKQNEAGAQTPVTDRTRRLAQAAIALKAPKATLRRILYETLSSETDRRTLRLNDYRLVPVGSAMCCSKY